MLYWNADEAWMWVFTILYFRLVATHSGGGMRSAVKPTAENLRKISEKNVKLGIITMLL